VPLVGARSYPPVSHCRWSGYKTWGRCSRFGRSWKNGESKFFYKAVVASSRVNSVSAAQSNSQQFSYFRRTTVNQNQSRIRNAEEVDALPCSGINIQSNQSLPQTSSHDTEQTALKKRNKKRTKKNKVVGSELKIHSPAPEPLPNHFKFNANAKEFSPAKVCLFFILTLRKFRMMFPVALVCSLLKNYISR
jgi:hypothetical protein